MSAPKRNMRFDLGLTNCVETSSTDSLWLDTVFWLFFDAAQMTEVNPLATTLYIRSVVIV